MSGEFDDAVVVVGVPGLNGGGATSAELTAGLAGKAPASAKYITQTADAGLTAEQALSSLSTGLVKVTTGTGVLSTAVGADLPAHNHSGVVFGLSFVLDGDGAAITTGTKYNSGIPVPVACTLFGWIVDNETNLSIATSIQRRPTGSATWTTISGSEGPTATTSEHGSDLSLTTWTVTSYAAYDQFRVVVASATSQFSTVTVLFTRSV
jgi:hypothetical protein